LHTALAFLKPVTDVNFVACTENVNLYFDLVGYAEVCAVSGSEEVTEVKPLKVCGYCMPGDL
jgi:hypothetical protein